MPAGLLRCSMIQAALPCDDTPNEEEQCLSLIMRGLPDTFDLDHFCAAFEGFINFYMDGPRDNTPRH